MYTGPNISDDGLVLSLDAANRKSYVSGSTTWTDLTRRGNNGTLVNGPTFSSANLGSIVFDGVNDYINFPTYPNQNQITCESWFRLNTSNIIGSFVAGWLMGVEGNFRLIYSANGFSWVCRGGNAWYSPGTFTGYDYGSSIDNTWFHAVGTYNGTYNSLYVNGILRETGSNISGFVGGGTFYIGQGTSNIANQKGNGSIYRIYNRALSAEEILQNYEGLKSRYGL